MLAFIVAYIFDPVVDFFERRCWPFTRKHIHRGFGIVFIIIAVLLTTAGFLTYAIPKTTKGIYQVGSTIKKQYPKYETTIEAWIEKYGHIELAKSVESLMKGRTEPIFKHDHEKITPANQEKEAGIKEYNKQELSSVLESDAEKEARLQKVRLAEILGGFKNIFPRLSAFS